MEFQRKVKKYSKEFEIWNLIFQRNFQRKTINYAFQTIVWSKVSSKHRVQMKTAKVVLTCMISSEAPGTIDNTDVVSQQASKNGRVK